MFFQSVIKKSFEDEVMIIFLNAFFGDWAFWRFYTNDRAYYNLLKTFISLIILLVW